jgi:hypothetical protein
MAYSAEDHKLDRASSSPVPLGDGGSDGSSGGGGGSDITDGDDVDDADVECYLNLGQHAHVLFKHAERDRDRDDDDDDELKARSTLCARFEIRSSAPHFCCGRRPYCAFAMCRPCVDQSIATGCVVGPDEVTRGLTPKLWTRIMARVAYGRGQLADPALQRWMTQESMPLGLDPALFSDRTHQSGASDAAARYMATVRDLACPVCNEVPLRPVDLECGHLGCAACMTAWVRQKKSISCPLCRAKSGANWQMRVSGFIVQKIRALSVSCPSTWPNAVSPAAATTTAPSLVSDDACRPASSMLAVASGAALAGLNSPPPPPQSSSSSSLLALAREPRCREEKKSCEADVRLGDRWLGVAAHIKSCSHIAILCGACNLAVTRGDYVRHQRRECAWGWVACPHCRHTMPRIAWVQHLREKIGDAVARSVPSLSLTPGDGQRSGPTGDGQRSSSMRGGPQCVGQVSCVAPKCAHVCTRREIEAHMRVCRAHADMWSQPWANFEIGDAYRRATADHTVHLWLGGFQRAVATTIRELSKSPSPSPHQQQHQQPEGLGRRRNLAVW